MDEHEDITEQLETENQMLWVHIISDEHRASPLPPSERTKEMTSGMVRDWQGYARCLYG